MKNWKEASLSHFVSTKTLCVSIFSSQNWKFLFGWLNAMIYKQWILLLLILLHKEKDNELKMRKNWVVSFFLIFKNDTYCRVHVAMCQKLISSITRWENSQFKKLKKNSFNPRWRGAENIRLDGFWFSYISYWNLGLFGGHFGGSRADLQ